MPVGRCRIQQKTSLRNSGVLGYLGFARFLLMRHAGVLPPRVWCPSFIRLSVQSLVVARSAICCSVVTFTLAPTPTASAQPARFARAGYSGVVRDRLACSTAHMGRNEPLD